VIENPLFIVGSERSGSNLLRAMLNQLPNVSIPHPPHLMRDLAPLFERYGDLKEDRNFRRLIDHAENLVDLHFAPWPFRLDKELIFDEASRLGMRDPYAVYALIYEQYRAHEDKGRWGCKSTFMINNVKDVLGHHGKAQFLHLVRDGRDVAASARRSIFSHYHPYFTAQLWAREQNLAQQWSEALPKEQWLTIHYEDLISEPEREARRICEFLGEPYSDSLLSYFNSPKEKKLSSLNRSWENLGQPVLSGNSQKYRATLSENEIMLFEAIAGEELKTFGYLEQVPQIKGPSALERLKFQFSENKSWFVEEAKGLVKDKNSVQRWRKKIYLKYLHYTV